MPDVSILKQIGSSKIDISDKIPMKKFLIFLFKEIYICGIFPLKKFYDIDH